VIPGVSAMAAPVFDHTGAIVLAVTAIGPSGIFDTRWAGSVATALVRCARQVSDRLGRPTSQAALPAARRPSTSTSTVDSEE